jgi:hypothetical protein
MVAVRAEPARGAGTDPTLLLGEGEAFASSEGVASVRVTGSFSFEDLVQFPFATGLIVWQGSLYTRYQFDGEVRSATTAVVADGITAAEIPGLLVGGAAAAAPASLIELRGDRIVVTLPQGFGAGAVSAVVYAILDGEAFVSNAVTLTLP